MKKIDGLECILLVDDDHATNFINSMIIKKAQIDVHVEVVTNGEEALEYLTGTGKFADSPRKLQPGIVFLDINMPAMNGWEFLEEYNKLPEAQKAQIVIAMLTTSLNPDDERKANGIEDIRGFLNKPLTVDKLLDVIERFFPTAVLTETL
ncbi:response regulator [Chitinophaga sedimenti]|uniref:response regulator n=1 Tax=Chitinophaga sedimenti TaxID=2033606 RepID=UPI002005812F|nr:response regulator [Chitinophaga sedimenti]MCK7559259.1 response regulator [Chitinophaga sedimenti]